MQQNKKPLWFFQAAKTPQLAYFRSSQNSAKKMSK